MKPFTALFALLPFFPCLAADETIHYRIDGSQTAFVRLEKDDFLISKACAISDCAARKELNRASTIGLNLSGGANPGAKICRKISGDVVIGLDTAENQVSFCRFSDGSMISSGSVYSAALKNDLKK